MKLKPIKKLIDIYPYFLTFRMHIKTVHKGVNKTKCPFCESYFISSYMDTHISSVHEKKLPHQCSMCSKRFAQRSNCIRHEASVHSIDHKFKGIYNRLSQIIHFDSYLSGTALLCKTFRKMKVKSAITEKLRVQIFPSAFAYLIFNFHQI